ncbi:hypothetical+protein [Methylocapsa aurea]|uniref:hypothetical protein n=1 Tax=Methylocapsa aurea TaxID=663610 RepID=UPI003D18F113
MIRKLLAALFALTSLWLIPAHADQITDSARIVWRDYIVDGVPSSGAWNPRKGDIRTWGALVGSSVTALQAAQTGAALAFDTKASLDASLAYPANTQSFVYADATSSNNGIYAKVGASGSGSWTKLSALVYGPTPSFALGTVTIAACNTSPAASLGGTALSPLLNLSFPACTYSGEILVPTPTNVTRGGVYSTATTSNQILTGVLDSGAFVTAPLGTGVAAALEQVKNSSEGFVTGSHASDPSNILYSAPGSGSVVTTLANILRETIYVDMKGAYGDGVSYDDAAFQSAANSLGGCGAVKLGRGKRYHLAGGWKIPDCVWFEGDLQFPMMPKGQIPSTDYTTEGAILLDASSNGIIRGPASGIAHTIILRYGISIPSPDASAFAGAATTCATTGTRTRDSGLRYVMVLGFQYGNYCGAPGEDAQINEHVYGDALNGLYLAGDNWDTSLWSDVRWWPYATVAYEGVATTSASGDGTTVTVTFSGGATIPVGALVQINGVTPTGYNGGHTVTASSAGSVSFASTTTGAQTVAGKIINRNAQLGRAGVGFYAGAQSDNLHMVDLYAGGFTDANFRLSGSGNVLGDNWWSDALGPFAAQIGVDFEGAVGRITLGSVHTEAGFIPIKFGNANIYSNVNISNLFTSAPYSSGYCMHIGGSGVNQIALWQATDCKFYAAIIGTTTAYMRIGSSIMNFIGSSTSNPYIAAAVPGVTADQFVFDKEPMTDNVAGASLFGVNAIDLPMIASAAAIAPPIGSNEFNVSGSTIISTITGTWGGRHLTLRMTGSAALVSGGNLVLQRGMNFSGGAGRFISFEYDGPNGQWIEMSRSPLGISALGRDAPGLLTPTSCGTSPSAFGTVNTGAFTTGSTSVTACTIPFGAAYLVWSTCVITPANAAASLASVSASGAPFVDPGATAGITIHIPGGVTSGQWSIRCDGW